MDVPRQVRIVLATVFVGGLLATLAAGLIWAYTPVGNGGLTFLPDQVPLRDGGQSPGPGEAGTGEAEPGDEQVAPSPEPEADEADETGETDDTDGTHEAEEAAAELIASAAEPGQTSVQVLEAGAGSAATESAARVLRDLGYRVTFVTSARASVERTTVWFTSGNEPEALALRARDSRFADVAANQGLNEATNLHVLVGPDWQD